MSCRFAFAARDWGKSAVVCRAVEDRPGPVIEQQFGEFATWTQANAFAGKLNEGLDLDPLDVQQIVTSSILATACVVHAALASSWSWKHSPVGLTARAIHIRYVLAELALARTFCRSARNLSGHHVVGRLLRNAQNAALRARQFIAHFDGDRGVLEDVSISLMALNSALHVHLPSGN